MKTQERQLTSWVQSANDPRSDFPIQNLPYGVFRRLSGHGPASLGVAIGDLILVLRGCGQAALLECLAPAVVEACDSDSLNALMSLAPVQWSALRQHLTNLLSADGAAWRERERARSVEPLLVRRDEVMMLPPAVIGDFTDFYASIHHATNAGRLFRPENPLLPNYKYVHVGYHGRSSSIVVSGTSIHRPMGQLKEADSEQPVFGSSRALDYEVEVGVFLGQANLLGQPVPMEAAHSRIFGLCLLNDWSARDIQAWEAQPLGPFLAKNFATTVSPWVVTMDALDPFRTAAAIRPEGDPPPLPYLCSARDQDSGAFEITLEAGLSSRKMREEGREPMRMSRAKFADLYWTIAQLLTHHASGGCNLRPGDLIGSGTVSGPTEDSFGSLLEITRRGAKPIHLPTGESRTYLEDGDEIVLTGYCEREGFARIGFGECRGVVEPPRRI
jgi:fumarylacetoacetase